MKNIKDQWVSQSKKQCGWKLLGKLSLTEQQYILFSVACCRLIWDKLSNKRSREAIEVAEAFAYGKATVEELGFANQWALELFRSAIVNKVLLSECVWGAVVCATTRKQTTEDNIYSACNVAGYCARSVQINPYMTSYQGTLLAQIVGEGVDIPKHVLTSTVTNLAKYIWDNRDWSVIPILADALQDVGFSDNKLLEQFRTETVWCRGGKAIDLLAGIEKE